ncbi:glutaredoxin family protein [Chromohalobacter sp. 296-RDG]|nr:glutaredoxin family protein [Chromohalobacter sp. 296-RDG]
MITVYTGSNCPHCTATKRALERKGIYFEESEITDEGREKINQLNNL